MTYVRNMADTINRILGSMRRVFVSMCCRGMADQDNQRIKETI